MRCRSECPRMIPQDSTHHPRLHLHRLLLLPHAAALALLEGPPTACAPRKPARSTCTLRCLGRRAARPKLPPTPRSKTLPPPLRTTPCLQPTRSPAKTTATGPHSPAHSPAHRRRCPPPTAATAAMRRTTPPSLGTPKHTHRPRRYGSRVGGFAQMTRNSVAAVTNHNPPRLPSPPFAALFVLFASSSFAVCVGDAAAALTRCSRRGRRLPS
mmetsp:Transcript_53018/g.106302  ORF Transcript_53018/g.106302 Transcript_53018/m.106302 type:complete len:212 (+) Transcript_53018:246-881(+)